MIFAKSLLTKGASISEQNFTRVDTLFTLQCENSLINVDLWWLLPSFFFFLILVTVALFYILTLPDYILLIYYNIALILIVVMSQTFIYLFIYILFFPHKTWDCVEQSYKLNNNLMKLVEHWKNVQDTTEGQQQGNIKEIESSLGLLNIRQQPC